MNNPQEIIVYRNPLERELYHSGVLFPIMCAMVVFFITFLLQYHIGLAWNRKTYYQAGPEKIFLCISGALSCLTLYLML